MQKVDEVPLQPPPAALRQLRKGGAHRTVPSPEYVHPMLCRTISEHDVAVRGVDVGCRVKELLEVILESPSRRMRARGRRVVAAHESKEPPDKSSGRPARQAYASRVAAHAHEFACRLAMVGRERDAER